MLGVAAAAAPARGAAAEHPIEDPAAAGVPLPGEELVDVHALGRALRADDVAEVEGEAAAARAGAPAARGPLLAAQLLDLVGVLPLLAVAVVLVARLRVGEHLVGSVDLLEARLRGLVAGVHVGVVLAREAQIRLADLLRGGVALHAERRVQVSCHASRLVYFNGAVYEI